MGQVLNKASEADAIAGTDDSRYMTSEVTAAVYLTEAEINAGLLPIIVTQQSANSGGMWGPRDGAGLHFIGNTAYLFGGWGGAASDTNWASGVVTNQVYRTTDFGVTWTRVRDHDATPDATHFVPGHVLSHASLTVSGTQYLYIFGGDPSGTGEYLHGDTRRTTDGITWSKVNSVAAGWQYISLSAGGSLNGNLYRAGGINSPGGTPNLVVANNVNSVWESTDDGVTWSNLGNAPWPAGLTQDHLPEFLGKLWRIGGGTYDNDGNLRTFDNAVWSFDGTTWTEVLANGLAPWAGRQFANAFVFDGWLYISRGSNISNVSDTWRTRNGIDWFELELDLPASHADGVAVNGTGVLVATGNYYLADNNVNGNSPSYLISTNSTASLTDGVASLVADALELLDNYVLYTGATGDLNLGEHSLIGNAIALTDGANKPLRSYRDASYSGIYNGATLGANEHIVIGENTLVISVGGVVVNQLVVTTGRVETRGNTGLNVLNADGTDGAPIAASGVRLEGGANKPLRSFRDATHSGIYNGATIGAEESILMGTSGIFVSVGGTGLNQITIDANSSATDTGLLLLADGSMKRVVMGAADTGGTGYRMLRVVN